jgi:hypothetical protein
MVVTDGTLKNVLPSPTLEKTLVLVVVEIGVPLSIWMFTAPNALEAVNRICIRNEALLAAPT